MTPPLRSSRDSVVLDVEVPVPSREDRPVHLACPGRLVDVAICGWRRPADDPPKAREEAPHCVVCLDLSTGPCPHCGERHYV